MSASGGMVLQVSAGQENALLRSPTVEHSWLTAPAGLNALLM